MTRQNILHREKRIYEQERKKYLRHRLNYHIGERRRTWWRAWWRAWKKQIERSAEE